MIRKITELFERSEDQRLEFDCRYNSNTKEKIKKRRAYYKDSKLFESWLDENKASLSSLMASKDKPKAMQYYYDLFTTDSAIKEIKALKKKGVKIIGTFCNLVPLELIYAAGAYPVRLCSGSFESIRPAEEAFPRDSCPVIKSSLGFAIADQPFLSLCDAIIIPATCDGKKKMGEVLNEYVPVWMLNLPQDKERDVSKKYWRSEMRILKSRLEELCNKKIKKKDLKEAILRMQRQYLLVRRLLDIRKGDAISGRDAFLVMHAAFFDDNDRWIEHTEKLCKELEKIEKHKRKDEEAKKGYKKPRILLTGAPLILPNFKIPNIIEESDAIIAMDETCAGSQFMYDPVQVEEWNTLDMMDAIGERYLMPSMCPCFIKGEDRIDKIVDMIEEYKIDAVIYHTLRLCLLFDIESLKVRDVMEEKNIPFLHLNTDYSKEDVGQLRTRIEAFVEIINGRKK